MVLKCMIIDDEPLAHNIILEYAKNLPYIEIVHQAYLPTKALEYLNSNKVDLLFLDIQMPKLTGLEMLRIANQKPEVIITSAYEEYALESYELHVTDYLLKPFRLERFIKAVDKAVENIKLKSPDKNEEEFILIKVDKRLVNVKIDTIQYLQSYGNYVKVITAENTLLTNRTMNSFVEELSHKDFFKTHKSYLINKQHVSFLEGTGVTMTNKEVVPISKHIKQDFLLYLGK